MTHLTPQEKPVPENSFFHKTKPALNWEEGHILGNGDLGAVVWGHPGEICIGLSKHDVNFLSNPEWNRKNRNELSYRALAEMFSGGESMETCCRAMDAPLKDKSKETYGPFPITCGRLSLFLVKDEYPAGIVRKLDWKKAECRVSCALHHRHATVVGAPTAAIELTAKVLSGKNLVLVRLSSEQKQRIQYFYSAGYLDVLGLPAAKFDGASMSRQLPEDISFSVALEGGDAYSTPIGIMGEIQFGGELGDATLKIAVATSFESIDTEKACRELLGLSVAELEDSHCKWWLDFWARSNVSISDPWLEDLWRFGVYAGGSGTRPDKSPFHLQGIWNQHRIPAWHCDMHFNANIQEAHWFAGPCNHPELEQALIRCMLFDWRENFREAARVYSLPGLLIPFCADWKGRALGMWNPLALAMGCTAWMCVHLDDFMKYDASGKWRAEIREFYREAAVMYLDVLRSGPDGKLHFLLSESPEQVEQLADETMHHVVGKDPVLDISATIALFKNFIKLSKELKIEDDVLTEVKTALPKMPTLPLHNSHFIDYATGYFHDGPAIGEFRWSHRHPSRLFPIFPGNDVNLDRDRELGVTSLEEFRAYGEDGFTSWSYAWQACIAAKLGLAELAEDRLNQLKSYSFGAGLMEHGSANEPRDQVPRIFQLEVSLGAAAAVTGMMLQETEKCVHLFPAIREEQDAAFTNLRLAGGALISAVKEGAQVSRLSIYSPHGGSWRLVLPYSRQQLVAVLAAGEMKKLI